MPHHVFLVKKISGSIFLDGLNNDHLSAPHNCSLDYLQPFSLASISENLLKPAIQIALKTKPTLNRIKDGKKIAMKKKINIGLPILFQIYVFYLNSKYFDN